MKQIQSRFAVLALVVGLGMVSSARADWTFSAATGTDGGAATTNYAGPPSLTITGVYAQNGATGLVGGSGSNQYDSSTLNSGFASGATWVTPTQNSAATLTYWSGAGVAMCSDGCSTPNHAIDNAGVNTEGMLMQFASSVVLSNIGLGYVNKDGNTTTGTADLSVFRYTGTSAPTILGGTQGASLASMTAAGWSLVGNYGGLTSGTDTINTGSVGSSWWLITAYNSSFGASTNGNAVNQGNDFFKFTSVSGANCTTGTGGNSSSCGYPSSSGGTSVPEPSSLALVGAALLAAGYSSRRRRVVPGVGASV